MSLKRPNSSCNLTNFISGVKPAISVSKLEKYVLVSGKVWFNSALFLTRVFIFVCNLKTSLAVTSAISSVPPLALKIKVLTAKGIRGPSSLSNNFVKVSSYSFKKESVPTRAFPSMLLYNDVSRALKSVFVFSINFSIIRPAFIALSVSVPTIFEIV